MDLNQKAQWHLDFNGGFVPFLETPSGEMIKESGIIVQLAIELGQGKGVDLVPKDPFAAAKMRLEIERCNQLLQPVYGIYGSRGEDPEKNALLAPTIVEFARMIKQADGKYLFGTDEPTQLDVMYMPFLETISDWKAPCVMQNILEDCKYAENGGDLIDAYVAKFRAHPLAKPVHMRTKAAHKHWERTRGWTKGVKCQLTVGYLQEAFE